MTNAFRFSTVIRQATLLTFGLLALGGCNRSVQPVSPETRSEARQEDRAEGEADGQPSIASIEPVGPLDTVDSRTAGEGNAEAGDRRTATISSDTLSPGTPSPGTPSPGTNAPSAGARPGSSLSGQDLSTQTPSRSSADRSEAPTSDPIALREQALEALDSGDTETALKRMRRLQTLTPLDHESTFLMARVLAERNRFAEAIWMLDELAESAPDLSLPVMGQTAEWMVLNGQWTEAEQRYRSLREAADGPLAMMVNRMLVQLLLRQGRREEAANSLREMCRFGDINEEELRALLSIAFPLANESIEEAELEPIGALGRARYEISQGNWQAAAETLKASGAKLDGEFALLGRIHAHQQDFDALEAWAEELPEAEKRLADSWFALAVLQSHQGKHREAVQSGCQVVLADPTDHQAYRLLGDALEALGQSDAATEARRRADKIQRTQEIGNAMAGSQRPGQDEVAEIAKLLGELKRPFEAFAWNAIDVIYQQSAGAITQEAAMQTLSQINGRRLRELQASQPEATREFILCGVDPDLL